MSSGWSPTGTLVIPGRSTRVKVTTLYEKIFKWIASVPIPCEGEDIEKLFISFDGQSNVTVYTGKIDTLCPPDSHLKVRGAVSFPGAGCPSHQPFHPGLCVPLSRGRLPPVINHSTLAYVCHHPGADCPQSSTIPPWPMCVTIQVQTAPSHQTFYLACVSLFRALPGFQTSSANKLAKIGSH